MICTFVRSEGRVLLFFLKGQKNVLSKFIEDTYWNKQKLHSCQSKKFSETSDTVRHLKTFGKISNEKSILASSAISVIF